MEVKSGTQPTNSTTGRTRVCVYCGKRQSEYRHLQFHRFPKEKDRCIKWLHILKIHWLFNKTLEQLYTKLLCSEHFSLDQYNSSEPTSRLRHDAWPDLTAKDSATAVKSEVQCIIQSQVSGRPGTITTHLPGTTHPSTDSSLPGPQGILATTPDTTNWDGPTLVQTPVDTAGSWMGPTRVQVPLSSSALLTEAPDGLIPRIMAPTTCVETSSSSTSLSEKPEAATRTNLGQYQFQGKLQVLKNRDGSKRTFMILNKSSFKDLKEIGLIQAVRKHSSGRTEQEPSQKELEQIQYQPVLHSLDLDQPMEDESTSVRMSALARGGLTSGDTGGEVTNQTSNHILNPALFVSQGVRLIGGSEPPLFSLNIPGSSTKLHNVTDSLGWDSDTQEDSESQKHSPARDSKINQSQGVSSSNQATKAKELCHSSSESAPERDMVPTRFSAPDRDMVPTRFSAPDRDMVPTKFSAPDRDMVPTRISAPDRDKLPTRISALNSTSSLTTPTFSSVSDPMVQHPNHTLNPAAILSQQEIREQYLAHTTIVSQRNKELKKARSDMKKKYQKLLHKNRSRYNRLLKMYKNLESDYQEVEDAGTRTQVLRDAKNVLSEEHVLFLESQMFIRNSTGKGNKFSKKFIKYLIVLFEQSPAGYRFLRTIFTIPSVKTIEKWRTRAFELLEEG